MSNEKNTLSPIRRAWRLILAFALLLLAGAAFAQNGQDTTPQPAEERYGMGALPSKTRVEPRQLSAKALKSLPASVDLRKWAVPVERQSGNSCVSWAVAYAMMGWYANYANDHGSVPAPLPAPMETIFAPMYMYSQTNIFYKYAGDTSGGCEDVNNDGYFSCGSYVEDALYLAYTQGVASKSVYGSGAYQDYKNQPTSNQRIDASHYKFGSPPAALFVRDGAGEAGVNLIKTALSEIKPVVIILGFNNVMHFNGSTSQSDLSIFQSLKSSSALPTYNDISTGLIVSGHAMLAVGYDDTGLIVQNSWGTGWGQNGFARLSWDSVKNKVDDAWVVDQGFHPFSPVTFDVTTANIPRTEGKIIPFGTLAVYKDSKTDFHITNEKGYKISNVNGCNNTLTDMGIVYDKNTDSYIKTGEVYTTGAITANCEIAASFVPASTTVHTVKVNSGNGWLEGMPSDSSVTVTDGDTVVLIGYPGLSGQDSMDVISTCGPGVTKYHTYTSAPITQDCLISLRFWFGSTPPKYQVTASTASGTGTIDGGTAPVSKTVAEGDRAVFKVESPDTVTIASDSCGGAEFYVGTGTLNVPNVTQNCEVKLAFVPQPPSSPKVSNVESMDLTFSQSGVPLMVGRPAYFKVTGVNLPISTLAFALNGCVDAPEKATRSSTWAHFQCTPGLPGDQKVEVKTAPGGLVLNPNTSFFVDAIYTVSASAGVGGQISPVSGTTAGYINSGLQFKVIPTAGNYIASVSGCGGQTVNGNSTYTTAIYYTTGKITGNCPVTATFGAVTYEVKGLVVNGVGGQIDPGAQQVRSGNSANLAVASQHQPEYGVGNIYSSCGGDPNGDVYTTTAYTTRPVTGPCSVQATFVPTASMPVVDDVIPTDLNYSGTAAPVKLNVMAYFKVIGRNFNSLNSQLAFALQDCASVSGGKVSNTEARFQCMPSAGGFKNVTVKTAENVKGGVPLPLPANRATVYVDDGWLASFFSVSAKVISGNGTVTPIGNSSSVPKGTTASFTITPSKSGDFISIGGNCPGPQGQGVMNGNTYTTGSIYANCTVEVTFVSPPQRPSGIVVTSTDSNYATSNAMLRVGVPAYFKVTGSNLPTSTLTLALGGCAPMTRTSSSASEAHFQCMPASSGTMGYTLYSQTEQLSYGSFFVAIAAEPTYTVTAVAGAGGTIDPPKLGGLFAGKAVSFTVTPNVGYAISSVSGCGSGSLVDGRYTTGVITGDCTVTASFAAITGLKVVSTDANFTQSGVTPKVGNMAYFKVTGSNLPGTLVLEVDNCDPYSATRTIINASEVHFQCTPGSVGGTKGIALKNKTGGQVLYSGSIFVNATYKVTAQTGGASGTINPTTVYVDHGGTTPPFTLTPGAGNSISYVNASSECGSGTLNGNTYTTGPVVADCTVNAIFVKTQTASVTSVISTDSSYVTPKDPWINQMAYFKITGIDLPSTLSVLVTDGCFFDQSNTVVVSTSEAHFKYECMSGGTKSVQISAGSHTIYTGSVFVNAIYTVDTLVSSGSGTITPPSAQVNQGGQAAFTITPGAGGYSTSYVKSGCGGTFSGNTYTLTNLLSDCTVAASFVKTSAPTFTVTPFRGGGYGIEPFEPIKVNQGATASFKLTTRGDTNLTSVGGTCGGTLNGDIYTTKPVTGDCTVEPLVGQITVTGVSSTDSSFTTAGVTPQVGNMAYFKVTGSNLLNDLNLLVDDCEPMTKTYIGLGEVRYQCVPSGSGGTKAVVVRKVIALSLFKGSIVVDGAATHTVTASAGAGGAISPSGNVSVGDGVTRAFTVTPSAGYSISTVGGSCGGALSVNTYTTQPITADCTVAATFAKMTYTVATSAGTGGKINPSGDATVSYGATRTYTVTPDAGYSISGVSGCGGSLNGSTYITGAITADCAVTAMFATFAGQAASYTVTASAGTGGKISPSGGALVSYGESMSYTITPDAGFSIYAVGGSCGGMFSGSNTYTTGAITGNCTVMATFAPSVATGGLTFVNAFSRKKHGTAGAFDLPINIGDSAITVEPRYGGTNGAFDLVFQFDRAVAGANATITGASPAQSIEYAGNEAIVHLTGVPDKARLGITLDATADMITLPSYQSTTHIDVGFLYGDVNGNRSVQLSDSTAVRARVGQPLTTANFVYDVNTNGAIQLSDDTVVRTRVGNFLSN